MTQVSKIRSLKSQAGFSLVELMVVVTIIGILATVAVPRFSTFQARARQGEAKSMAKGLYSAMQAYADRNDNRFFNSLTAPPGIDPDPGAIPQPADVTIITELRFEMVGSRPNYSAFIISGEQTSSWSVMLSSNLAMGRNAAVQTFDYWRQNANNWICAPYDAVNNTSAVAAAANQKTANNARECPQTITAATANATGSVTVNPPTIQAVTDSIY